MQDLFRARFEDPMPRDQNQEGTVTIRQRKRRLRFLDGKERVGEVELQLSSPSGTVQVRFFGGTNDCTIRRPAGVAVRIYVSGGSSKLTFDDQRIGVAGNEIRSQSPDYDEANDRYDVEVSGGACNFTIGVS